MIPTITITDTMEDIIPDTPTEAIMVVSIVLSILHTTTLISITGVIIQMPLITEIQGIMRIMEEEKGKVSTLQDGTAICLPLHPPDAAIVTCQKEQPLMLQDDHPVSQLLLLLIQGELYLQFPVTVRC